MKQIHIKPDVVVNSSKLLSTSSMTNNRYNVSNIRNNLDYRIRSRNNIDGRLHKTIQEVNEIERKMREIEKFMQQSMERYTHVERNLVNRSSMLDGLGYLRFHLSPAKSMAHDKRRNTLPTNAQRAWETGTDNRAPWLQQRTAYNPQLGFLYPIGPAASFDQWVNPSCPRPPSPPLYKKMGEAVWDFSAGVGNGLYNIGKDTWEGIERLIDDPIAVAEETAEGIKDFSKAVWDNPSILVDIGNDIYQSFDEQVLNGTAETRGEWIGYAMGVVGTSALGDKGLSKLGNLGKLGGKLGRQSEHTLKLQQAGKQVKNKPTLSTLTNSTGIQRVRELTQHLMPNRNLQPAFAGVPHNVIDTGNLRNQIQHINQLNIVKAEQIAGKNVAKSMGKNVNEVNDHFIGTLKGEKIHLKGVKVEEIIYTKRLPEETAKLRMEFNNSVRKNYLKEFANDPIRVEYLRKAGLGEEDITRMKNSLNPKGWQVHHNLPLDDGGTNDFTNLVLIKNDPYHKVITNEQNSLTRGMLPRESKTINWPILEDNVYPPKPF